MSADRKQASSKKNTVVNVTLAPRRWVPVARCETRPSSTWCSSSQHCWHSITGHISEPLGVHPTLEDGPVDSDPRTRVSTCEREQPVQVKKVFQVGWRPSRLLTPRTAVSRASVSAGSDPPISGSAGGATGRGSTGFSTIHGWIATDRGSIAAKSDARDSLQSRVHCRTGAATPHLCLCCRCSLFLLPVHTHAHRHFSRAGVCRRFRGRSSVCGWNAYLLPARTDTEEGSEGCRRTRHGQTQTYAGEHGWTQTYTAEHRDTQTDTDLPLGCACAHKGGPTCACVPGDRRTHDCLSPTGDCVNRFLGLCEYRYAPRRLCWGTHVSLLRTPRLR